jgi:hypothetical protein
VAIGDRKAPEINPVLVFTQAEWMAFKPGMKVGESAV